MCKPVSQMPKRNQLLQIGIPIRNNPAFINRNRFHFIYIRCDTFFSPIYVTANFIQTFICFKKSIICISHVYILLIYQFQKTFPFNKKLHCNRSGAFGTPEGIRIPDLPLRRRTLYPAELLGHVWIFYSILRTVSRK